MKGHGHELLGCTWLYRRLFLPPVSAPPTAPHNVLIFGADGRNGHMVDRAVWTGGASLGIHRCPRWMGRVVYVSTLPRCSFGDRTLLRDQHGTRGRGMAVGVLHLYLQKRNSRRKGAETAGGARRSRAGCRRRRVGEKKKADPDFRRPVGSTAQTTTRAIDRPAGTTVVGRVGCQPVRFCRRHQGSVSPCCQSHPP